MTTYKLQDRDENTIIETEFFEEIPGEENQLLTTTDIGDEEGEWLGYSSPISRGESRPYVWRRADGTEITIGYLVCE